MPEGPEIRRAADQLAAAMVGKPLTEVWFAFPALKTYEPALMGETIDAFETRGKALLTHFSNGLTLYSHNQLYGVWRVVPSGTEPNTSRQLRVRLGNADRAILLYSASDIELLNAVFATRRTGRAGRYADGGRGARAAAVAAFSSPPVQRFVAGSGISRRARQLSARRDFMARRFAGAASCTGFERPAAGCVEPRHAGGAAFVLSDAWQHEEVSRRGSVSFRGVSPSGQKVPALRHRH